MDSGKDKEDQAAGGNGTKHLAAVAILTAVTTVFTYIIRVPIAPTRGYINLGDVAIYFTAFTFGPLTALFAGGLGPAIADILAGYSQWAPITLGIHGLQGLLAGYLFRLLSRRRSESPSGKAAGYTLGGVAGTVVMTGFYFLAGGLMVGFGAALVEVPGNLIQNAVGLTGGIVLTAAVRKAYPPVERFSW
ncbi:MAG: ECF transporter S component [Spirochaetales bacterium]|nr:ECF transporter S component [Spirochaetales bacterium]